MLEAPVARDMLAPATRVTLLVLPFKAKLVATGDDIVTDPAPTPTLTAPAPENTKALLYVPVLEEVVFPLADIDMVEKLVTDGVVAEMVS